jgi:hypothetical protein
MFRQNKCGLLRFAPNDELICPTGKSLRLSVPVRVQPPREKYFAFAVGQINSTSHAILSRKRGASRSSRTLVRDAVDAEVSGARIARWTNGADADGEVVWS